MTVTELSAIIYDRLDEDAGDPRYWTSAEVVYALNEAQRLFVFLTLCIERTAALTIPAASPFFSLRSQLADFLFPLRMTISNVRIRPARLSELDSLNYAWQAATGTPSWYAALGMDLMAVTPQPAAPTVAGLTYAAEPVALVNGSDTPEIPAHYHASLADYAVYALRLKEGAIAEELSGFQRFMEAVQACAALVTARNRAAQYDQSPPELKFSDFSREAKK